MVGFALIWPIITTFDDFINLFIRFKDFCQFVDASDKFFAETLIKRIKLKGFVRAMNKDTLRHVD